MPFDEEPDGPLEFPDPQEADADGLVGAGGDLTPESLVQAYRSGIFPWYDEASPLLWWSPDPRAVLPLERLHVSRRLARRCRRRDYRLSWDEAFPEVMRRCGENRDDGTWILPEMVDAYSELHRRGLAHSFEVWVDGELAGGLYGVLVGGLFAAESMFHRHTDASKIALVAAVRSVFAAGVELFDVQFLTPHLASMGATNWRRSLYLARLAELRNKRIGPLVVPEL